MVCMQSPDRMFSAIYKKGVFSHNSQFPEGLGKVLGEVAVLSMPFQARTMNVVHPARTMDVVTATDRV